MAIHRNRNGSAFDHLLRLAGGRLHTLERAIVDCGEAVGGDAVFADVEARLREGTLPGSSAPPPVSPPSPSAGQGR